MANKALHSAELGKTEWNKYLLFSVKNNQEMLLDLAYFALQEQPEDNFMVARYIFTMTANPWNYIINLKIIQWRVSETV